MDATIEDLSITGCRLTTGAAAEIDEKVMIGLAGVGIRNAHVVWAEEDQIGCAFDTPLSMAEIQKTREAETVAKVDFPSVRELPAEAQDEIALDNSLSPRTRLAIITAAALGSWLVLVGFAYAGYLLFAS